MHEDARLPLQRGLSGPALPGDLGRRRLLRGGRGRAPDQRSTRAPASASGRGQAVDLLQAGLDVGPVHELGTPSRSLTCTGNPSWRAKKASAWRSGSCPTIKVVLACRSILRTRCVFAPIGPGCTVLGEWTERPAKERLMLLPGPGHLVLKREDGNGIAF